MNKDRRAQICAFVEKYTSEHGKAPTVREIGAAVGITSTSTTAGYLYRLSRDGFLRKGIPGRSRNYEIPA